MRIPIIVRYRFIRVLWSSVADEAADVTVCTTGCLTVPIPLLYVRARTGVEPASAARYP